MASIPLPESERKGSPRLSPFFDGETVGFVKSIMTTEAKNSRWRNLHGCSECGAEFKIGDAVYSWIRGYGNVRNKVVARRSWKKQYRGLDFR